MATSTTGIDGRAGELAAAARAEVKPSAARRVRLDSVDLLRGLIMIVMALDHTRDYFGDAAASPVNLATTTIPLFFTRWTTNICAPVFFLLAGTGAYFAMRRRTPAGLSRFLVTRGLWLIVLELTVMRFIIQFNVDYRATILTVLWAFGWSMIALALIVRLPLAWVTTIGAAMVLLHNLLDRVKPSMFGALAPLWIVLHVPGPIVATPRVFMFAAYPLVPWIGVMALGFSLGRVLTWDVDRRRRFLLRAGCALTTAFVVLRALDRYGDPQPWSSQQRPWFSLLSFLGTTKYPPSLLFLLMTLGPALLILYLADGGTPRWLRPALTFGRVPLFYFLLHFAIVHVLAVIACAIRYGTVHWMFESPSLAHYPVTQPPGWPVSLPAVYLIWTLVVVLAYPACRWYASVKARRTDAWLSYL